MRKARSVKQHLRTPAKYVQDPCPTLFGITLPMPQVSNCLVVVSKPNLTNYSFWESINGEQQQRSNSPTATTAAACGAGSVVHVWEIAVSIGGVECTVTTLLVSRAMDVPVRSPPPLFICVTYLGTEQLVPFTWYLVPVVGWLYQQQDRTTLFRCYWLLL